MYSNAEFFSIVNIWDDPTHVRPYNKTSLEDAAKYFNFKITKDIKHHIRINPIKLIINLMLGCSISSGITLIFKKNVN